DWREIPNAAPITAQLTSRDRRRSTTHWSWLPLPFSNSSIGSSLSSKRSVGSSSGEGRDIFGGRPSIISLHNSTHSSEMKILAGPEISFLTLCCDLKQKEQ